MTEGLAKLIELLQAEAENPPHECDRDSYSRGLRRAIDELENLLADVDSD